MQYIDIKEFVDEGYLQEVNRQFFHPLGLALAVAIKADGTLILSGVADHRDLPEGYAFADLSDPIDLLKSNKVQAARNAHVRARWEKFGFVTQPIGDKR